MTTAAITLNETKIIQDYGRSSSEFLKKLHYWTKLSEIKTKSIGIYKDGKRWFYNTNDEWASQIGYSKRQVQRSISQLAKDGLVLLDKYNRYGKPPLNTIALNSDKMIELGLSTISSSQSPSKPTRGDTYKHPHNPKAPEHNNLHSENTKQTKTTVQDMIIIWNLKFLNQQEVLTKERGKFLYSAYTSSFNSTMTEWEDYCTFLRNNSGQNMSIDIALKFQSINSYKNRKDKTIYHPTQTIENQNLSSNTDSFETSQTREDSIDSRVDTSKSQDMLDIWNSIFGEKKSTVSMTSSLEILLAQTFQENFKSNLKEWKTYCCSIESSPYIMSSSFTLHIKSALKKEFIDKINAKQLGVTKVFVPEARITDEVENHLSQMALTEDPFINQIRRIFISIYGAPSYKSWIMPVGINIENGELTIHSENAFMKDMIRKDFYKIFEYVKSKKPAKPLETRNECLEAISSYHQEVTNESPSKEPLNTPEKPEWDPNVSLTDYFNQLSLSDLNRALGDDDCHFLNPQRDLDSNDLKVQEKKEEGASPQAQREDLLPDINDDLKEDESRTIQLLAPESERPNLSISLEERTFKKSSNDLKPGSNFKKQGRHNPFQNVIGGGGLIGHSVTPHIRTRIHKQHNNNQIKTSSFSIIQNQSTKPTRQQVKNYYLKNRYSKEKGQINILENKIFLDNQRFPRIIHKNRKNHLKLNVLGHSNNVNFYRKEVQNLKFTFPPEGHRHFDNKVNLMIF